jgi:DNA-binding CsgD family transcriptional regulator/uncharacterized ParB-like nuclease family protein
MMFQTENSHAGTVDYLSLDEIRRDGGTQPRAAINLQHVKLLSEQLEDGQQLEPVTIFYDGESYWLADGFHRWHAHKNQGEDVIACTIYTGTRRDAVLYSVGANSDHKPALPRSREDKRRAVMTLLQDPEWQLWSDREIARQCKVSDKTVAHLRNSADTKLNKERKAQRGGKTYTLNTTKIGKKASTPKDTNRVTIKPDHPLFGGQSGTITQHPNPDAAIVRLDTGKEELIYLKDLTMEQPEKKERPELAHHLKLTEGGLVEICVSNNSRINNRLGRIAAVRDNTVEIWVRDVERMMMHLYTLKHQQVEPVPMDREAQLVEVSERIAKLRKCNLDPFEVEILLLLERPVVFTPTEMEYLAQMEQRHEGNNSNADKNR